MNKYLRLPWSRTKVPEELPKKIKDKRTLNTREKLGRMGY